MKLTQTNWHHLVMGDASPTNTNFGDQSIIHLGVKSPQFLQDLREIS